MNKTHRPEGDGYAVEVSLLKLRPPVLVLAGACFATLVTLLSWLGGTTQPLAASKGAANHGANQERRVAPPALPNSATSGQARDEEKRAAAPSVASSDAVPGPSPAGFAESTPQSAAQSPAPAATSAQREVTNNAAASANADSQPAPAPASTNGAAMNGTGGGYAVQAGSFLSVSEANERVSALRAAGFEARTAAVELPKRGTWYRVYSGRFASREEAAAHDKKLRASGAVSETIVAAVQD